MVSEVNTVSDANIMWDLCNEKIKIRLMQIANECDLACLKHPNWPNQKITAAAIVAEGSGELIRAALQYIYQGGDEQEMTKEAIQTGAASLRFLLHMPLDM